MSSICRSRPRRRGRGQLVTRWVVACLIASGGLVVPVASPGDVRPGGASAGAAWSVHAAAPGCGVPPPAGAYRPPVGGVVVDAFRPPNDPWGPGNRGWEYAVTDGAPVHAAGTGVVAFAGSVAGHRWVAIAHADGLRTSYGPLRGVSVVVGARVAPGDPLGTAGTRVHFGVRCGDRYLDPALVLTAVGRGRPRLVPVLRTGPR